MADSPSPVKLGATPPGSTPFDNAIILKEALGLPMQIVSGYKGTAEIRLAIDAGEVAGLCGLAWASIKVTWRKQLDSGEVKVVLQNAAAAHPELPDVPLAISFAKNEAGRKLIQFGPARYRRDHLPLFFSAWNAERPSANFPAGFSSDTERSGIRRRSQRKL